MHSLTDRISPLKYLIGWLLYAAAQLELELGQELEELEDDELEAEQDDEVPHAELEDDGHELELVGAVGFWG